MGFLNPFMLFGITAVSVPIIIHLLNRRKFQKVVWAAMRFLKVSVEQNQRRMKVEDMILLLLRCLLLILLALALARPAMKQAASEIFGQTQVTAVVVLDNSLSMGMSDGTQTRFEKAKKTAEQAMETMPAGSSVAILLASDIVNGVVPEPTFDFNLARKAIKEAPSRTAAPIWGRPSTRPSKHSRAGSPSGRKFISLPTARPPAGSSSGKSKTP